MSTLQWDKVVLSQVVTQETVNFDDAFALIPIKDNFVHDFNLIMGAIPIFQTFINTWDNVQIRRLTAEEYAVCFPLLSF